MVEAEDLSKSWVVRQDAESLAAALEAGAGAAITHLELLADKNYNTNADAWSSICRAISSGRLPNLRHFKGGHIFGRAVDGLSEQVEWARGLKLLQLHEIVKGVSDEEDEDEEEEPTSLLALARLLSACSSLEDLELSFEPSFPEVERAWFVMPHLREPLQKVAPRLRRLSLRDALWDEGDVTLLACVLANAPHLTELHLMMEHALLVPPSPSSVMDVLTGPSPSCLERLVVTVFSMTDDGASKLGRALQEGAFPRLRSFAYVSTSYSIPIGRRLRVSTAVGPLGMEALLLGLTCCQSLEEVDMQGIAQGFSNTDGQQAESVKPVILTGVMAQLLPRLRKLSLTSFDGVWMDLASFVGGAWLQADRGAALSSAGRLSTLDLTVNDHHVAALQALSTALPACPRLTDLTLRIHATRENALDLSEGAVWSSLLEGLSQCPGLRSLDVSLHHVKGDVDCVRGVLGRLGDGTWPALEAVTLVTKPLRVDLLVGLDLTSLANCPRLTRLDLGAAQGPSYPDPEEQRQVAAFWSRVFTEDALLPARLRVWYGDHDWSFLRHSLHLQEARERLLG
jgi:hypothetical protein